MADTSSVAGTPVTACNPSFNSITTADRDPKKKDKKWSKKYNFPDGDVDIVSSDGMSFKVHSYILCAAR
jgi:hypothetical protein